MTFFCALGSGRRAKPGSIVVVEEGMLEKECGGNTKITTADFLHWSMSTGNMCNLHSGRGCLQADVRCLKRRLKGHLPRFPEDALQKRYVTKE